MNGQHTDLMGPWGGLKLKAWENIFHFLLHSSKDIQFSKLDTSLQLLSALPGETGRHSNPGRGLRWHSMDAWFSLAFPASLVASKIILNCPCN